MRVFSIIQFGTMCMPGEGKGLPEAETVQCDMEAENMGEKFYRDLDEFQAKYPTVEEREQALRTMSAAKILQLSRSCGTLQGAIWYARFAQAAAERKS